MFFKKYRNSLLFGLLGGLAFAPIYLIIFLPFSFFYLMNKILDLKEFSKQNYLSSFLYGTIFGFGYYLIQLYWISFSLLIDIKTYFWLFPLAIIVIPILCSFYIGAATTLFYYIINKFSVKNKFLITIVFSFCYVLFEYLKGLIFPWNLFSYVLGFSDILIQIVCILNIYIYNFILIILFCFSFVLFNYRNRKITFIKENKYYSFIYLFIIFFIFFFGLIRLRYSKVQKLNLNFKIVQANIPQTLKWNKDEIEKNLNKYLEMSKDDDFKKIDVIVWSESSIPYIITKNSKLENKFSILNEKILISGAIRGELSRGNLKKIWNSIFIFNKGKVINYYDKTILVPFGEYIPFSNYIPFFKKLTEGDIEFSKGAKNQTVEIKGTKISPLICYEIIFPNNVIDKRNRPTLIINLTNDAWFGNSSGPYQHLIAAKFRAIENKIPIIRSANSGISAYIDEYGRIVKKIGLNKSGTFEINSNHTTGIHGIFK